MRIDYIGREASALRFPQMSLLPPRPKGTSHPLQATARFSCVISKSRARPRRSRPCKARSFYMLKTISKTADGRHDLACRITALLEGDAGDVRVPLHVFAPKRQHLGVLLDRSEDLLPMGHPCSTTPFTACRVDGFPEGSQVAFSAPEASKAGGCRRSRGGEC